MPIFSNPAYRGVSYSDALLEAAAVAPIDYLTLYAYELWHPTLDEPIYFVNDLQDLEATIEADATRNAGVTVTFLGVLLAMQRPEESDTDASPQVSLSREGVSGILKVALDTARGSTDPWELIERVFTTDDLSGPAKLPPMIYNLSAAQMASAGASISAGFGDFANVSVPTKTFRREKYPTLDF
jgi:hypothetical protein